MVVLSSAGGILLPLCIWQ